MNKVKLGIAGAGLIGMKHAELVQANDNCMLGGISDKDAGKRDLADKLGTGFYGSAEDLIQKEHPDGMIIATPNSEHAQVAMTCAAASVHVLIEKPIAETLEQAMRIIETADKHGISVLAGHHRRHNPLVHKTRELVRGGTLGNLIGVSGMWTLLKPDNYFGVQWRREPPGGGPLLINLVHDLDSLRYICGEVTEVFARTSSNVRGLHVEDSLSLSLRFRNGALGAILASDASPAPWSYEMTTGENPVYPRVAENCYHFSGTLASLAFPGMELWHYPTEQERGWHHPLQNSRIEVAQDDPLKIQLEHFCRVIRGKEDPLVTGRDAAASLALVLAARESASRGVPVELPELK